jgi:hypothetical protein
MESYFHVQSMQIINSLVIAVVRSKKIIITALEFYEFHVILKSTHGDELDNTTGNKASGSPV